MYLTRAVSLKQCEENECFLDDGRRHNRYRYFVPAKQLIPLHEHSDIQFKSKDREQDEYEDCPSIQAATICQ